MDADYDIFEIVAVIRDFWLVDAESYQRRYSTNDGQPLAPGYYVVNWPEHIQARRFNDHAMFYGPFKLRMEAQEAHDLMHKHWKRVLIMSSGISSVVAPNSSRMEVKKAPSQVLRLAEGEKAKQTSYGRNPQLISFATPDHRKSVKVAGR